MYKIKYKISWLDPPGPSPNSPPPHQSQKHKNRSKDFQMFSEYWINSRKIMDAIPIVSFHKVFHSIKLKSFKVYKMEVNRWNSSKDESVMYMVVEVECTLHVNHRQGSIHRNSYQHDTFIIWHISLVENLHFIILREWRKVQMCNIDQLRSICNTSNWLHCSIQITSVYRYGFMINFLLISGERNTVHLCGNTNCQTYTTASFCSLVDNWFTA